MFNLKAKARKEQQLSAGEKDEKLANDQSNLDEDNYPQDLKLFLIFLSLVLTTFLVALDTTILATAIPTITSEFISLGDVSWYNSVFLLTTCAFQLPYGRAYKLLDRKWTFLSSILIFEIGSAVSGSTPNSIGLIFGRAIQGVGGAGIFGGCFIIIAEVVPLPRRPLFNGVVGGTFGIASVAGPLLGGAFTTSVTWRWDFWINLPLGAIVFVVVFFFLNIKNKDPNRFQGLSRLQIFWKFDPLGTIILLPSITCLLLALQWGGQTYPWSDARVIALLVVFGISIIGWVVLQYFEGDNATVPVKLFKQRTVSCATLYMLMGTSAFSIIVFYLPLWFQGIKQDSAQTSGIHQLPLILSLVFFSLTSGGLVVWLGYYVPFLYVGTICMSVGAGLLSTLQPDSGIGTWLGYQILFGAGVGMTLEQCNIAVQTVLDGDQIQAGTSLVLLARSLGGSIAISIGESVFEQQLRAGLSSIPSLDPSVVTSLVGGSGATDLINNVSAATGGQQGIVQQVLGVYNSAVTDSFYVAVALAALTIFPAIGVEWRSVKKNGKKTKETDGDVEESRGSGEMEKEEME